MRLTLLLLLSFSLPAKAAVGEVPAETELDRRAYEFFQKQEQRERSRFSFNPYENLISGVVAFVVGNVGYLTTESTTLKLSYSAIQTIGIIDIGQGIYHSQAPSMDSSLRDILTEQKDSPFPKERLARRLLQIFAQEDRAKRLSVFYSSSFLTLQYAMNATIYKSSGQLKKIYLFLGSVNAIVAVYSALYKSDYEKAYYGEKLDLSPFATGDVEGRPAYGLMVGYRF